MNRTSQKANEFLAQVVERFRFHADKAKSDNPLIAESAEKMCSIEIWEMWVLTQEGGVM